MEAFSHVIKKYSLHFPHMPLPTIIEQEGFYNVFIFNIEIEISQPNELEMLLDQVIKKVTCLYENRQKKEEEKINNNIKINKINNNKNNNNQNILKTTNINNISKINAKSTRGKMKIKNLQTNRYIPTFSEDINENKNNILTEPQELYSEKITKYCHDRNLTYPEYVFEKSNGVYLCKALFMKEKFESRYAYDMKAAKEDASSLIYSYIKFLDTEDTKRKCTEDTKRKCTENTQNKPSVARNTNYSDMFNNTEKDEAFDIANFFTF